jgi:hypothetical protein
MDPELHYGLVVYLGEGKIPNAVKEEIKQKIHKTSKNYKINKNKHMTSHQVVTKDKTRHSEKPLKSISGPK